MGGHYNCAIPCHGHDTITLEAIKEQQIQIDELKGKINGND